MHCLRYSSLGHFRGFNFNPSLLFRSILLAVDFAASLPSQLNTECEEGQTDEKYIHEEGTLNVIEDQRHIGRVRSVRSWLVEPLLRGPAIRTLGYWHWQNS